MKSVQKLLIELVALNLPLGEYVIVSSGVMAIKGIRECNDLDLVITESLFNELSRKYPVTRALGFSKVTLSESIEGLYFEYNPNDMFPASRQIQEAEIIQGFPFQKLETCLYFKENSDREKDKKDAMLIKEFISKNHAEK